MSKKKSLSRKSGPAKKMSARPAVAKKTAVKKTAAKKAAVTKTRKAAAFPGGGRRNKEKGRLIVKITELAETLGNESLVKLLNDAAILAHNERVIREFEAGKRERGPRVRGPLAAVEEGKDGTYFMVTLNGHRSIFGLEEMRNLVRACHGARSATASGPRLYAWLERERRDVLKNSKIADNEDPSLPALWKMVVGTYHVSE